MQMLQAKTQRGDLDHFVGYLKYISVHEDQTLQLLSCVLLVICQCFGL